MSPKKSGSRVKKAAGLSQLRIFLSAPDSADSPKPILSFQSRKPSAGGSKPSKPSALRHSTSQTSIPAASEDEIVSDSPVEVIDLPKQAGKTTRRQLDPKSKQWNGIWKDAQAAMGNMTPIHAGPQTHDKIHHILRVFDMTSKYGPSVGISRLQRWERAKKWGLNPPEQIRDILTTQQGEDDPAYRENVLYAWLG